MTRISPRRMTRFLQQRVWPGSEKGDTLNLHLGVSQQQTEMSPGASSN